MTVRTLTLGVSMSELVASYATDRYVLRLIRPDASLGMILVGESDSGTAFIPGADLRTFEANVEDAKQAEENYWFTCFHNARLEDKPLFLSGWEHFRMYSGLPELNLKKENNGNDQS